MELQVIGAGVGRTGTLSLKTGLEQLTGQPCYHMLEVFAHPDHVDQYGAEAAEGEQGRLGRVPRRLRIHLGLPGLPVLARDPRGQPRRRRRAVDPQRAPRRGGRAPATTIFAIAGEHLPPEMADWFEMWRAVASARFTADWTDKDAAHRRLRASQRRGAGLGAGRAPRGLAGAVTGGSPCATPWTWPCPTSRSRISTPGRTSRHVDADTSLAEALEQFKRQRPAADLAATTDATPERQRTADGRLRLRSGSSRARAGSRRRPWRS